MKNVICFVLLLSLLLGGCSVADDPGETTQESTEKETVSLKDKKLIALTFDDGPNESVMVYILDILEKYDVPATFFVIGRLIDDNTRRVVKRAYDMGCEIGNHSMHHVNMAEMTEKEVLEEFETLQSLVEEITGERPKYFRPPGSHISDTMHAVIDVPFIGGFSCKDWEAEVTPQQRIEKLMSDARDGAVFLLHCSRSDGGSIHNMEVLKHIIPALREQGYEFVTLSQMFELKGVTPAAHEKIYYKVIG